MQKVQRRYSQLLHRFSVSMDLERLVSTPLAELVLDLQNLNLHVQS